MGRCLPFVLLLAAAGCAPEPPFDEFEEAPACVDACGAVTTCVGNRFATSACINRCDDLVGVGDVTPETLDACAACVGGAGTSECRAACGDACADLIDFAVFEAVHRDDDGR